MADTVDRTFFSDSFKLEDKIFATVSEGRALACVYLFSFLGVFCAHLLMQLCFFCQPVIDMEQR